MNITNYHDPGSGTKTVNLYLSRGEGRVYLRNNYNTGGSTYNIIRTNPKDVSN